jgi:hypothetical protein
VAKTGSEILEFASLIVGIVNNAKNESACNHVFGEVLSGMPRDQSKRADFLWKIGLAVRSRLNADAAEFVAYVASSRGTDYTYDLINTGEAARALNIVFESAQRFSGSTKAQQILVGAMTRATDDTFALRLLEYTENKDRNKVFVNHKYLDKVDLKRAFVDRMTSRYGREVDANLVNISTGDTYAFGRWIDNSKEDGDIEVEIWKRYIGSSRKPHARAIKFIYPAGYTRLFPNKLLL